jgi:hypothetical protein
MRPVLAPPPWVVSDVEHLVSKIISTDITYKDFIFFPGNWNSNNRRAILLQENAVDIVPSYSANVVGRWTMDDVAPVVISTFVEMATHASVGVCIV